MSCLNNNQTQVFHQRVTRRLLAFLWPPLIYKLVFIFNAHCMEGGVPLVQILYRVSTIKPTKGERERERERAKESKGKEENYPAERALLEAKQEFQETESYPPPSLPSYSLSRVKSLEKGGIVQHPRDQRRQQDGEESVLRNLGRRSHNFLL